jgi:kynurenine formamidase
MRQFVELSHTIVEGMRTYPGLPEPRAEVLFDHAASRPRYGGESEFLIASLHLCGNTGTYVDAPFHRYPDGIDLAGLPLERLAHLEYVAVDARLNVGRGIGRQAFAGIDAASVKGKAVLVYTGWADHWGQPAYFEANPHLTGDACQWLADAGALFVGIDSVNIDDMADMRRPAHTILLGNNIPVCEHMTNLEALADQQGRLHAVPIAWRGGATFPVRAYVVR